MAADETGGNAPNMLPLRHSHDDDDEKFSSLQFRPICCFVFVHGDQTLGRLLVRLGRLYSRDLFDVSLPEKDPRKTFQRLFLILRMTKFNSLFDLSLSQEWINKLFFFIDLLMGNYLFNIFFLSSLFFIKLEFSFIF